MPTELHLALQRHYAGPTGVIEAPHGRYKIDALREGVAYEVQTGSFFKIRHKVQALAQAMPVVIVYPLPTTKFIVRLDPVSGAELKSRRSPKHGRTVQVCAELRQLVSVLRHPSVCLEVAHTVERELWCEDGQGSWRRQGVSVVGRELIELTRVERFGSEIDYLSLLPEELPTPFTVTDIAQAGGFNRRLADSVAFVLFHLGVVQRVGKRANAFLYEQSITQHRERSKPALPTRR